MTSHYDLSHILAGNIQFFMDRAESNYRNANALAVAAKISPNTVRNLLHPKRRTVTSAKPDGFPTLDKLLAISIPLGCEVWELLHPDIKQSIREREMYKRIDINYKEITKNGSPKLAATSTGERK